MKWSKIIVILTLIIIVLIGIICNFINITILNKQKLTLKEMSDTEYENNIASLNASHTDYANYIQEIKTKIASDITDMGVNTSAEETLENMVNNIRSIDRKISFTKLGSYNSFNATTIDCSDILGFEKLTVDNFLIVSTGLNYRYSPSNWGSDSLGSFSITKSYDALTGKLVISRCIGGTTNGYNAYILYDVYY